MTRRTMSSSVSPQRNGTGKETQGIITHIQSYSLHNGTGIRSLAFLKGCPLECKWCCNPECQSPGIEIEFYESKCVRCGACLKACNSKAINPDLQIEFEFKVNRKLCNECGDCVRVCPKEALKYVGEVVTVEEVLNKIKQDKYFYIVSQGGLTLSGGEPLYQFEFTREVLKSSYDSHIDTAIETCGYAPWEYFEEIIPYLDSVLYDVKHMDPAKHKRWTVASNELILSNLTKLSKTGVPIIARLPLVPGFNLDEDNIAQTGRFLSNLENVREVNLLPFHQLGRDKYHRLSRRYSMKHLKTLDSYAQGASKIRKIKSNLEAYGLDVTVS